MKEGTGDSDLPEKRGSPVPIAWNGEFGEPGEPCGSCLLWSWRASRALPGPHSIGAKLKKV